MNGRTSVEQDDRGTSLILALVFVFVIGMVLVAVGGLAANAMLNSSNARAQRTSTGDAEAAVTIAMQYLRYNPVPAAAPSCLPPNSTIPSSDPNKASADNPVQVDCTVDSTTSPGTRIVDFYACPWSVSSSACEGSAQLLHAQVAYNDVSPTDGTDECYAQPVLVTTSCGMKMNVVIWDVAGADS